MMSKCFDEKTTFPDTFRHFRPAIEISRSSKRATRKADMLGFAADAFEIDEFRNIIFGPHEINTRAVMCTIQMQFQFGF